MNMKIIEKSELNPDTIIEGSRQEGPKLKKN